MARPPRKTVDYFPHFIGDGKKAFFIDQKYGNDGYSTWFRLLETLAKTEDHWLNLNEETEIMFLAAKCRVSEEMLLNILNDLAKLDQINAELWKSKVIWSDKFIESIEDVYLKRSNNCITLEGLRCHLLGLGILKGDVKPQTKLNYTKLKETKEDRKAQFKELLTPFLDQYDSSLLNDFYSYWTESGINDKKLRFEKEKSFDIGRRLSTWKRNEEKFNPKPLKPTFVKNR